jgi:cysteine desulfurase/selenocysteine lyase
VTSAAPALEPRFGGAALGVGVPDAGQRPLSIGVAVLFLRDTRRQQCASRELPLPSHDVPRQSLGLPAIDDLRSFNGRERSVSTGGEPDRSGSFYFLENARAPVFE